MDEPIMKYFDVAIAIHGNWIPVVPAGMTGVDVFVSNLWNWVLICIVIS